MHTPTRRAVLATSAFVAVNMILGTRTGFAMVPRATLPHHLLPPDIDPTHFRQLAMQAIDVARAAGAPYADCRIGQRQSLRMLLYANGIIPYTEVGARVQYSLRVLVNGAWGIVHGSVCTSEALTTAVRAAISQARLAARVSQPRIDLAPLASVARGDWSTPMRIDPFSVSLDDHFHLLGALRESVRRQPGGGLGFDWTWIRETNVFTSTEGASIAQTRVRSIPKYTATIGEPGGGLSFAVGEIAACSAGYESVNDPVLQERIAAAADDAQRISQLPITTVDIGRYRVVCDGLTLGALFGTTIAPALELDRALGDEMDASGTSFLAPPLTVLGTDIVSPVLTVHVDRSPSEVTTTPWDAEGVASLPFTLIEHGRVMDYFTTRTTAPALAAWYQQHGKPVHSNGSAAASLGATPTARSSCLRMVANSGIATRDDLCRSVDRGVLALGVPDIATDQQLASVSMVPGTRFNTSSMILLEIVNGQPIRRIVGSTLQGGTSRLWKSVQALGDASTSQTATLWVRKGTPWQEAVSTITAPAAIVTNLDVIALPRGASDGM